MTFRRSTITQAALVTIGTAAIIIAVTADRLGLGGQLGFGLKQMLLAAAGWVLVLSVLAIRSRTLGNWLRGDGNKQIRHASPLLLLFGLTAFALAAWQTSPFLPDDSYISFRYAENLAHGNGLTFNAHESPVEGYSNLLWILSSALFIKLRLSLPVVMPVFGAILGMLSLIVFWTIIRRRQATAAQQVLPFLLLAFSAPLILYSVSGLETPLFAFLLLLGILCFERILHAGRAIWLVALASVGFLLVIARPEGMVFYPVTVSLIVLKSTLSSKHERSVGLSFKWLSISFALFVLLTAAYELWRVSYFGEYVPTPFLSKGLGGRSLLSTWSINMKSYFFMQGPTSVPFGYYLLALMVLAATAILGYCLDRKHLAAFETAVFVIALTYTIIYTYFVDWMPGMRYYAPLIPLYLISGTLLFRRTTLADGELLSSRTVSHVGVSIIVLILNLSFVSSLTYAAIRTEQSTAASLVALGRWLKESVPSNTLLAISDVGATPYYSGLPTLDINPESLTDIHIAKNGWSNEYFFERRPGIVIFVSFSLVVPRFYAEHQRLLVDPMFSQQYRLIGKTRYDWYRDRSYWVYAHRSIPFDDERLLAIPQGLGD